MSDFGAFTSSPAVTLGASALLQPLRIDKAIKRLEANKEIFLIVIVCFGD